MLKLEVGSVNNRDINIDDLFYVRSQAHPEWFEDPFVRRMIQEVDKTEVLGNGAFQSPVLGIISSDRLSGGVKTLIILYELPTIKLWGSACGDNCLNLMFEISKMHDITVKFSHIPYGFPHDVIAMFVDNNTIVYSADDLRLGICDRLVEERLKNGGTNYEEY